MSSAVDVLARANALLQRLEGLIASARAIDLPAVLAELGVVHTARTLTEELVERARQVHEGLAVVSTLGQLGALFGLLEPLVASLGGVLADGGRAVASLGLESAFAVNDGMASGFSRLEGMLAQVGSEGTVVEQARALQDSTLTLIGELEALAAEFRAAEGSE